MNVLAFKSNQFYLFAVFHLNLMYSSIEEDSHPEVIRRCYWPLLDLAENYQVPLGIEASGLTLEIIKKNSPEWIYKLKSLITQGLCEFIGSGYAQMIGPLVPAEVNAANLRLGNEIYENLLGILPQIALVNEQAYSCGLVHHFVKNGYQAILMEWDNPASQHPEWLNEWRYLPQYVSGPQNEEIMVIWNSSIAFQKFQRYVHDDLDLDEYLTDLRRHAADMPRTFPIYGNDAEIFDYRPKRYHTEAALPLQSEWQRIRHLLVSLKEDSSFVFMLPKQVLNFINLKGAGHKLTLESATMPIPVKKQDKYNITRWAVTGRDDLGINTACWRIYQSLVSQKDANDDEWRELCYLWSSDFRTHITEKRWKAYLARLERIIPGSPSRDFSTTKAVSIPLQNPPVELQSWVRREKKGRILEIETDKIKLNLNCRRGLAIDALWFKEISDAPLCITLPHGYYDDIAMGADYYSGHLVLEIPGQPKITDLTAVDPKVEWSADKKAISISGEAPTPLGAIQKRFYVSVDDQVIELTYELNWDKQPKGSLRLGAILLNPLAFDNDSLYFRTHNGGVWPETFFISGKEISHGQAPSFSVSALGGLGITQGWIELGDAGRGLRITVDKGEAALIGLISYKKIKEKYFYRLSFSAAEMDETVIINQKANLVSGNNLRCSLSIRAFYLQ